MFTYFEYITSHYHSRCSKSLSHDEKCELSDILAALRPTALLTAGQTSSCRSREESRSRGGSRSRSRGRSRSSSDRRSSSDNRSSSKHGSRRREERLGSPHTPSSPLYSQTPPPTSQVRTKKIRAASPCPPPTTKKIRVAPRLPPAPLLPPRRSE